MHTYIYNINNIYKQHQGFCLYFIHHWNFAESASFHVRIKKSHKIIIFPSREFLDLKVTFSMSCVSVIVTVRAIDN